MRWIFLILFFSTTTTLCAQTGSSVLMTEVSKGIKLSDPTQVKWSKVQGPGVLPISGRLKLNGKARVMLYCEGAVKTLEGKGEYDLSEVFREQERADRTEWEKQFNTFLAAAGDPARSFGRQLPVDQAPIKAVSPVGGKLATFEIRFYWQTKEAIPDLKLEIADAEGKALYTAEARGGEAVVDPRQAKLFPGQTYGWRVYSSSQTEKSSAVKTFQMNTLGQRNLLLPALKEEKAYQEAPPFIQSLMEAAWFENLEWYFDAHQAYRKLLDEAPGNGLYVLFYQAFLRRCGVGERAE